MENHGEIYVAIIVETIGEDRAEPPQFYHLVFLTQCNYLVDVSLIHRRYL